MKKELSSEAGPKLRVFFHYAIPSVLGMVALSSAEVIDGIFVGNFVGAEALAAVNLTIPLVTLISGIIIMLTVGGGVVAGKSLGEKNAAAAADTFTKTCIGIGGFCGLSMTVGLIFLDPLISLLGANEILSGMVREYLFIFLFFIPGFAFSSYFISLHKAAHSASIALLRSLVLPVVLVLSLSALLGDVGIFIAIPLAEYATLCVALLFFSRNRPGRVLAEGGGVKKTPPSRVY